MNKDGIYPLLRYLVAGVWIANGLCCKVFGLVPRHQAIVAAILGQPHARPLTIAIGLAETALAAWIASGIKPRLAAVVQIVLIAAMNTIEFFIAPGLLLWGKANALFALLFIALIYMLELRPRTKSLQPV